MNSLPEEIFTAILFLVCDSLELEEDTYGLPHLATVSRRWQHTIESRTFRELALESNQLPDLNERFSGPFLQHRAITVRSIEYTILLPSCSDEEVHQRATEQDVHESNSALSKAMRDLFSFLLILDQPRQIQNGPCLELRIMNVMAPTDGSLQREDPDLFLDYEHGPVPQMSHHTYWSLRWRYNILRLLHVDDLPEIAYVTFFEVYGLSNCRHIHPSDLVCAASKFPYLETLRLEFNERRAWGKEVRRTMRRGFAEALLELANRCTSSLNKISLCRRFSDIQDESRNQLDYGVDDDGLDVLSKAIFIMAQRCTALTDVRLSGFNIAPELFWPYSSNRSSPSPDIIWPSLKYVEINFHAAAANGEWYFTNPDGTEAAPPPRDPSQFTDDVIRRREQRREPTPYELGPPRPPSEAESFAEYGDELGLGEQLRYRTRPLSRTINPLLIAVAKAVRYMPSLKEFALSNLKEQLLPYRFISWRQGEERMFKAIFRSDEGRMKAELAWDRTPPHSWKPSKEVREEWEKTVGVDGEVQYMYSDYCGRSRWEWETLSAEELGDE